MTHRRLFLGIVIAAIAGVTAVVAPGIIGRTEPTVPTMTVKEAAFRVRVTAEGNLAAVEITLGNHGEAQRLLEEA